MTKTIAPAEAADLLYRNAFKLLMQDVTLAVSVGTTVLGGVECDHLLFSRPDVDFQVWVEKGDKPLPRKLVINSLADETQPQYTAVMNWNLTPKIDPAVFTFVPDANAKRIPFMTPEALAAATAAKKPAKK